MPTLFKRSNGIYYISFQEEGKRKWRSTGQRYKPAALKELFAFEKLRITHKPKTTLQAFAKDFLAYAETSFSPKTLIIYKAALGRFLSSTGNKLLPSITAKDIDLFRVNRLKEVSPVSVNVELRTLRAAFYTALRWKLIAENPFRKVALVRIPEREPAYFTKEELQRLLSCVSERWLRDLIFAAVCTGLRRGELLNLTWRDVDFSRRLIHVQSNENFRTKWGRRRSLPINETLYQLLWTKAQRSLSEYVFTFEGTLPRESWVSHLFKRYVRKAGLNEKLHFHSLRHTFATWLVQEGVSIYEVQKLLGHSSISVTQVYSHLAASDLHGAVNKISVSLN